MSATIDVRAQAIAARIRECRTRLGLTQAQLAAALSDGGVPGMSGTAVGRMETGQRSVRLSEGPVLAAVLGLPLHELVDIPESHPDALLLRAVDEARLVNVLQECADLRREAVRVMRIIDELGPDAEANLRADALARRDEWQAIDNALAVVVDDDDVRYRPPEDVIPQIPQGLGDNEIS